MVMEVDLGSSALVHEVTGRPLLGRVAGEDKFYVNW